MDAEDRVKLFVLANSLAEHRLDRSERDFGIDLGRQEKAPTKEEDYYAQFDAAFRKEKRSPNSFQPRQSWPGVE